MISHPHSESTEAALHTQLCVALPQHLLADSERNVNKQHTSKQHFACYVCETVANKCSDVVSDVSTHGPRVETP